MGTLPFIAGLPTDLAIILKGDELGRPRAGIPDRGDPAVEARFDVRRKAITELDRVFGHCDVFRIDVPEQV
jgi:hypothetical protein